MNTRELTPEERVKMQSTFETALGRRVEMTEFIAPPIETEPSRWVVAAIWGIFLVGLVVLLRDIGLLGWRVINAVHHP